MCKIAEIRALTRIFAVWLEMTEKSLKIGIVMDPIDSITPYKDSSLAMLLEAERRSAEIHYFEQKDLRLLSGKALGQSTLLHVRDDNDDWYSSQVAVGQGAGPVDTFARSR
jgi:hypothetical protein